MNMDKYNFIQILSLCDDIRRANTHFEKRIFNDIDSLRNLFVKIYHQEKSKLPYHINIIDLLHANENAHSRILGHLLKQNHKGRNEILESFLSYITVINPNYKLQIESPRISIEKKRIDILIRDKEYSIIIENKIHNAVDQDEQLARYIKIANEMGYSKDQIYILYLPRDSGKSPDDKSWGIYKEHFKERYAKITYYEDILPWLREILLPEIKIKDIYLKSCIEQYIDHLEGLFSLRNIQTKMNKELKDHISEAIGLGTIPEQNYSILSKKIEELDRVRDQLTQIKYQTEKECWCEWHKRLTSDFPNLEIVENIDDKDCPKVGVKIPWKGKAFSVSIEKEKNIYYGIGRHYSSQILDEEIKVLLKPLLDGFKSTEWWYGWKYTSFENAYKRLKVLIEKVVQLI